jgi:aromatic-L-amino-acid/L-tryptophan decarboxylase
MTQSLPIHTQDSSRFELDMSADEFRSVGHRLIDELAAFYESLPNRPVTKGESAGEIRAALPQHLLPAQGRPAAELLAEVVPLLLEHSLYNGHPRFFGYITSSPAPLGALADLLASAINQNCGLRNLSPAANEIEIQAVDWLAELVGFPRPCGGVLVSGGNVANLLGFFAARRARLSWDVRRDGIRSGQQQPCVYASRETHTWIEKAADLSGIGTNAIRWIATDASQRLRVDELERAIAADRDAGHLPFLVVGTAGNVSTGAVDPLTEIADIAAREQLWLHVDGAYGAAAAALPEASASLKALSLADSVALDPHKWLYNPIEVACTLVRDPNALRDTFSYRPTYYRFEQDAEGVGLDYFEHGLQNTRGFRALKVWLCLQQAGRDGYVKRIRTDIELARLLYEIAITEPELEAGTQHLSITTFRYHPTDLPTDSDDAYLDELSRQLLATLQTGGEAYVSNALLGGRQFLRACIVNFRTTREDIEALAKTVVSQGRQIHAALQQSATER